MRWLQLLWRFIMAKIFGAKFAKSSYTGDVDEAADHEVAFDTSKPIPKFFYSGPLTFTVGTSSDYTILNHNLGYTPQYLIYTPIWEDIGGGTYAPNSSKWVLANGQTRQDSFLIPYATDTAIKAYQSPVSRTFDIYLYVMYDDSETV